MLFLKSKTVKDIEARARLQERRKADAFYTKKMDQMRDDHLEEIRKLEEGFKKKLEKNKKDLRDQNLVEIQKYRNKIMGLNNKNREVQKAWMIFKEWIPEALHLANAQRAIKFDKQQIATKEFAQAFEVEDGIESLQRKVIEQGQKIEKLLGKQD